MTLPAALATATTLARLVRSAPIAGWRAWHAEGIDQTWEPGRIVSSQRFALQSATRKYNLCFGGNRTGKTEWLRALCVAYALGSDHPAIVLWGHLNQIDLTQIPRGPGEVWCVAPDFATSVKVHRRQIDRLLGPGDKDWWGMDAESEARVRIKVPGYESEAVIVFKANKQGREAFQASSLRAVFLDEEGSEAVFEECEQRVGDQAGRLFLAMSPLKGLTWVHRRFVETIDPEAFTYHLVRWDNPFYPHAEKLRDKQRAERDPGWADARIRGLFVVQKGRIYTTFSRSTHVVPAYPIPPTWPRHRGIDFGTSPGNPHVCTWAAERPDGQIVVYRHYRREEQTIKYHAEQMLKLQEPSEVIVSTWCDPEDPGKILSLRRDHPIGGDVRKGDNRIDDGIDEVKQALLPMADGQPGIVFFYLPELAPLFVEFDGYQWAEGREKPREGQNDHGLDTIRYIVRGIRRRRRGIAVG